MEMVSTYSGGGVSKSKIRKIIIPYEADISAKQRWCSQCRQFRFLTDFHSNAYKKDGLATECKECANRARVIRKQNALNRLRNKPIKSNGADHG